MGKYTNEKSLVVVQDNFLNRVKNFFAKAFWNRRNKYEEIEEYEEEDNYENRYQFQEPVQKERRLYDFDADNTEEWPGDSIVNDAEVVDENGTNVVSFSNESDDNYEEQDDVEEDYDREIYSQAYIEKVELEQKLMNY